MHSMRINRIWYPRSSAFSVLQRSVRFVATSIPQPESDPLISPFAKGGSATLVRSADKRYVICTGQQVGHGKSDMGLSESLVVSGVRRASDVPGINGVGDIPIVKCQVVTDAGDGGCGKLFVLEVADRYDGMENDLSHFIDLDEDESGEVERSVAIGNLTTRNSNSSDREGVNIRSFSMYCYEDLKFTSSAQFLRQYTYIGPDDLDGVSGGAVFSLRKASRGLCARFEGIVTRGGSGFLHVISADYLRRTLPEIRQDGEAA